MQVSQSQKPEPAAGKKENPEALRRTSQQFEAIFIQQLFKGMRATVPTGDLLENDRSIEIYQGLMDQQVAETMARKQGLGIGRCRRWRRRSQHLRSCSRTSRRT
jgi:flagellar protein FlgJ